MPERLRGDALDVDLAIGPEDAGEVSGTVVVHRRVIVAERLTGPVLRETRFDVWSCTKSLTALAFGMLLDDARAGRTARPFDLETRVYDLLDGGRPLTDARKAGITLRHLLSMTSGIPGERAGLVGNPTPRGVGLYEHALGFAPNADGRSAATLAGAPGTVFDYSDPACAHLAPAFAILAGRELDDYLGERLFAPLGIARVAWDRNDGRPTGAAHANAHTGLHLSAEELARVGELLLRGGRHGDRPLVPAAFVAEATRPSQALEPCYGLGFWVNTGGRRWPGVPADAFALSGFRCNVCVVVPSLEPVVARVASGPARCDKAGLAARVVRALGAR
jgi:CubicO group peptidase (beta-lactamase class C family)